MGKVTKKKSTRKYNVKPGSKDTRVKSGTEKQIKASKSAARANFNRQYIQAEDKAFKKVDQVLIDRYLSFNSHLTVDELIAKLNSGTVNVLEGMLIKGYIKAYRTGDPNRMQFYLDRLIGPVVKRISHALENKLENMTNEELIKEKEKYEPILRKQNEWHNMLKEGYVENQLKEVQLVKDANPILDEPLEDVPDVIPGGDDE